MRATGTLAIARVERECAVLAAGEHPRWVEARADAMRACWSLTIALVAGWRGMSPGRWYWAVAAGCEARCLDGRAMTEMGTQAGAEARGSSTMPPAVRILVVDDDAEMRVLLAEELRREGWEAREAGDGAEAVLACRIAQFDVILMDKNMPGPSGLDLLPGFRRTCPDSRIILMTAFGDVPSYVEAAEKGAVDFLFKPFKIDQLKTAIRKALGLEPAPPA